MRGHFLAAIPLLVLGTLAAPLNLEGPHAEKCSSSTVTIASATATVYVETTVFREARAVAITKRVTSTIKNVTTSTKKTSSSSSSSSSSSRKTTSTAKQPTLSATKKTSISTTITKKPSSTSTSGPTSTTKKISSSSVITKSTSSRILSSSKPASSVSNKLASVPNSVSKTPPSLTNGRRNVLYFPNWSVYGANYQPQDLPADKVTHLLYSFADIDIDGTVIPSDSYADIKKHYSTDSWSETGNNVYGCVKQIFLLKKKYRAFKTLISIGGASYSPKIAVVAATEAGRQKFATSAVKLVADWGLDGVDIDWEYPKNVQDGKNYVLLLRAVRRELNKFSEDNNLNYRFHLTVATGAGPDQYKYMDIVGMNNQIDAWNLMAYDYAGPWSSVSGHQANVFASKRNPQSTPFNTEDAVNKYISAGVAPFKISLGLPLYGRSFARTSGLGKPFSGVGGGTREQGAYLYSALPRPGAIERFDATVGAAWSYDENKTEFVTYDTVESAKFKTSYILKRNIGGAVYWEASGDKKGDQSIVRTVARNMEVVDTSQNLLRYPTSQYGNIRAGMPS